MTTSVRGGVLSLSVVLVATFAPAAQPSRATPQATWLAAATAPSWETASPATSLAALEARYPDLKVLSPQGHPWRIPQEDWTGARRRLATNARWRAWLKQEQAAVEGWMALPRDRADWQAGYYHNFVSPKDGSHLTWTPEIPGEQVQTFHSPSDPHVAITPTLFAAWVAQERGTHAGYIARAALLYRLTGEERYGTWAAAQLDFYAAHYAHYPKARPDQEARLYWQTLDEAVYATSYIEAVRLLDPMLENEAGQARKRLWWSGFFEPQAQVLASSFLKIHNIALWQRAAVAQIALVYQRDDLWREAVDGPFGFRAQLARGITADGLWYEQSFHYNEYVVSAAVSLFRAAGLQGRGAELQREMALCENLLLAPIYLRFPDGSLPNPADGTGLERAPHEAFLAGVARLFPTTVGLAAAQGRHDAASLLDPLPPPPHPPALPPVTSLDLASSGMALLCKGPWQVFLHVGQLDRSHAQAEALNYSVSYASQDITHDPGTCGYGSPFHRDYFRKGLNHNVVLIDGEGQTPPQRGSLLRFDPVAGEMQAEQPHYQEQAAVTRELSLSANLLTDRASVQTTDGRRHRLGLALHLQGALEGGGQALSPDPNLPQGRPAAFVYWTQVQSADCHDRAAWNVRCGSTRLRVSFELAGPFRVWCGSTPDVPPARRLGFYLETEGNRAVFTTRLEPLGKVSGEQP